MKNWTFPDLHQHCNVANTMLILILQEIRELRAELKAEIQSFKASEECLPHTHPTPSLSVVATSAHHAGGTAVRPSHYPPSILWNIHDARSDPHVVLQPRNPSRIPMASALRHENGDVVGTSLYKAIRASGKLLVENVLFKGIPKDITFQTHRRTKRFFMDNYKDTWDKVIHQYEVEQPLLRLCAGHWKAEHMLGWILTNMEAHERKQNKREMAKRSKTQQKEAGEDEVITTSERRRRNCVVENEEYESQKEETGELRECRNGIHYHDEDVEDDELLITPVSCQMCSQPDFPPTGVVRRATIIGLKQHKIIVQSTQPPLHPRKNAR
jgi:hypothetical protein